jgi:aryl-alcohol dehydrogenase-like predicted oxidoreductase
MDYRNLKGTELSVARACFGTMTFGGQVDAALASRMVDVCMERGINFFDTANVYQQGLSEELLGKALQGKREKIVLASKVRGKMGEGADQKGLSKAAITRAVDESLKRLQTDFLDIYYLHQPDYDVPIEETLEAMEELVKSGKVRYPATSNYASWQGVQMLDLAGEKNYRPASIAQQMYNLLARGLEQEFIPMAKELGVSVIAYNPLAGGLLTGKHVGDSITPGTRFDKNSMYQDRYWHGENFRAVERLQSIAEKSGRSLISLSLNWLMHHTPTDCVILGASKLEQLEQNLNVLDEGSLPAEVVEGCNEVWRDLRGPTPVYNR